VHREGDIFVVEAPGLERIVARTDVTSLEVRQQLKRKLAGLGMSRILRKAGIKPGDKVRCGDLEWEW
jgi:GTP-binding protein